MDSTFEYVKVANEFTSLTLLLAGLGELQEMAIRIAEEGPDLVAPIDGRGEELGSAGAQHLVSGRAIRHPDGQLASNPVQIGGRGKGHGGLILRGSTWDREQDLTAPKAQEAQSAGKLAHHRRS